MSYPDLLTCWVCGKRKWKTTRGLARHVNRCRAEVFRRHGIELPERQP